MMYNDTIVFVNIFCTLYTVLVRCIHWCSVHIAHAHIQIGFILGS